MTIGKKLYLNFRSIWAMVVVLFLINLIARATRSTARRPRASQALQNGRDHRDKIRFQMMQNRLSLRQLPAQWRYREVERLNDGRTLGVKAGKLTEPHDIRPAAGRAGKRYKAANRAGARNFCRPLMDKRKEVDSGNATVAELQIFYLQKDASAWVKNASEYLGCHRPRKYQGAGGTEGKF